MVLLRRLLMLVLFVGAAYAGAAFSKGNEAPIAIDYLFGTVQGVPLWIALVSTFALGVGLCFLAVVGRLTRSSLAQRRYRKTVAALEAEVHQLRNLPIEGTPAATPAAIDAVDEAPAVAAVASDADPSGA